MDNGIKYKVVTLGDVEKNLLGRRSTNHFTVFGQTDDRYIMHYEKGKIIRALPGSIGILVFSKHEQARMFIYSMYATGYLQILQVKPIGKMMELKGISMHCDCTSIKFFYEQKDTEDGSPSLMQNAPEGTECYPAVEVLE